MIGPKPRHHKHPSDFRTTSKLFEYATSTAAAGATMKTQQPHPCDHLNLNEFHVMDQYQTNVKLSK